MNTTTSPADALRAYLPGDVTQLDSTQAGAALGHVKAARGFLDAYEARLTSHITRLHAAGQSAPASDLHTRDGGVSSKEAKAKEREQGSSVKVENNSSEISEALKGLTEAMAGMSKPRSIRKGKDGSWQSEVVG